MGVCGATLERNVSLIVVIEMWSGIFLTCARQWEVECEPYGNGKRYV